MRKLSTTVSNDYHLNSIGKSNVKLDFAPRNPYALKRGCAILIVDTQLAKNYHEGVPLPMKNDLSPHRERQIAGSSLGDAPGVQAAYSPLGSVKTSRKT